jgi:hypothetical protein
MCRHCDKPQTQHFSNGQCPHIVRATTWSPINVEPRLQWGMTVELKNGDLKVIQNNGQLGDVLAPNIVRVRDIGTVIWEREEQ